MNGLLVFLILLNAYFLLIYVLVRKGWLAKLNLSLFGPALMLKTQRGRGILDWFARAKGFFDVTAAVGLRATFFVMFLMSLLLVVQLLFIFQLPAEAAPSPRLILGIPGINPLIPLGYGILALVFAVVVHEFGHGILARVHELRVKTMGLLFLIVPVGAFVEPDEDQLKAAPRRVRQKVFAAGPTMNLAFALVFALVFSPLLMGSLGSVDGAPLRAIEQGGPADLAGLKPGWVVTHVNNVAVQDRDDFVGLVNATTPGTTLYLRILDHSASERSPDYPVVTKACVDLYGVEECERVGRFIGHPDPLHRTVMGIGIYDAEGVRAVLASPFAFFRNPAELDSWRGLLYYISLPFEALQGNFPLSGAFQQFYEAPFHAPTFWILVNSAYWLFWINLMLGLTNALPIVPLDGGYMFRDWLDSLIQNRRPHYTSDQRAQVVKRVSLTVTLFLVSLVLLQFVGPRLAGLF